MVVSELISRYVETRRDAVLSGLGRLLLSVISRLGGEDSLTGTIADRLQILGVLLHDTIEGEHRW